MTKNQSLKKLLTEINFFVENRDWRQFHSPKNLAMALSVEAAELLEIFQWLSQEQSYNVDDKTRLHIEEEIGDIMIYLTNLSSKFGIDPIEAALKKMVKNNKKYPAEKVCGRADKYTTYSA